MTAPAIHVDGLSKRYRIGGPRERYHTLRDQVGRSLRRAWSRASSLFRHADDASDSTTSLWALKDVSFDVAPGEVLGVIGANGSGKTTLLRLLSRITDPTEGHGEVRGRTASLLEVGTGFHPELTGRENVYLSASILGMRRLEIDRSFDAIAAFSGIEKHLETPVKQYSSGMYLRLAFAVAAHLEPEILLVDEVLAVGDAAFQRKCLAKMGEVAQGGRTVLLVSHNMGAVSSLCPRTIVLEQGRKVFDGKTEDAIRLYLESMAERATVSLGARSDRVGNARVRCQRIGLRDGRGDWTDLVPSGAPVTFEIEYQSPDEASLRDLRLDLRVRDQVGVLLFTLSNFFSNAQYAEAPPRGRVRCHVPELLLAPGRYSATLVAYVGREQADCVEHAFEFGVVDSDYFEAARFIRPSVYGPVLMPQHWDAEVESPLPEPTA